MKSTWKSVLHAFHHTLHRDNSQCLASFVPSRRIRIIISASLLEWSLRGKECVLHVGCWWSAVLLWMLDGQTVHAAVTWHRFVCKVPSGPSSWFTLHYCSMEILACTHFTFGVWHVSNPSATTHVNLWWKNHSLWLISMIMRQSNCVHWCFNTINCQRLECPNVFHLTNNVLENSAMFVIFFFFFHSGPFQSQPFCSVIKSLLKVWFTCTLCWRFCCSPHENFVCRICSLKECTLI